MITRVRSLLLTLALVGVAGCSGAPVAVPTTAVSSPPAPSTPTDPEPVTPSPTADPTAGPVVVDWTDRPADARDLGDGWAVTGCEGDAPLLCVTRDGQPAGLIELVTFPLDPAIAGEGRDREDQLEAQARAILDAHGPDRQTGCPPGYAVVAPPPTPATVAGDAGMRYEFAVHDDRGERVEHVIGFVSIRDSQVTLLVANALGDDACIVDDEFAGFTPEDLAAFAPRLDRIAENSRLPAR